MNSDDIIDMRDLLWMSQFIGRTPSSGDWAVSRYADVNEDNTVNILDLIKVNQNQGM